MRAGFLFLFFFFLCAAQLSKRRVMQNRKRGPPFDSHFSIGLQAYPEYPVIATSESAFSALVEVRPKYSLDPTEFAILLDRSGSMWSERLVLAKLAIEDIILHMTSKDKVHLIAYDDTAELIFADGTKETSAEMLALLDPIQERGFGNLGEGIDLCLDYLLEERESESEKPIARTKVIVLFTDGAPNVGETNRETLWQGVSQLPQMGVHLVVFGVGDDQDVAFLSSLAQYAQGKFFPLEHASQIEYFLSFGLRGRDEALAKNVKISLTPKGGVNVTMIRGPFNANDDLTINIPFLRYGERVSFLMLLDFDFEMGEKRQVQKSMRPVPEPKPAPGEKYKVRAQDTLVRCKLEFESVKQMGNELKRLSFVNVETGLWLNATNNTEVVAKARNVKEPNVRLRHAIDWVIMLQGELMDARNSGDLEAVTHLQQNFASTFYEHFPHRLDPSELPEAGYDQGQAFEDAAAAAAGNGAAAAAGGDGAAAVAADGGAADVGAVGAGAVGTGAVGTGAVGTGAVGACESAAAGSAEEECTAILPE